MQLIALSVLDPCRQPWARCRADGWLTGKHTLSHQRELGAEARRRPDRWRRGAAQGGQCDLVDY